MDNGDSLKRSVISSYISSMIVILIAIPILIIVAFLNWEDRRIKSDINTTIHTIQKELSTTTHLDNESTIKFFEDKVTEFGVTQGDSSALNIKLIYNDVVYTNDPSNFNSSYKDNLGEFNLIFENKNFSIVKNILLTFGAKKIYIQVYSNSKELERDLRSLIKSLFYSGIFILIISLVIVRKIDKIIQLPIQEITKTVKKINKRDLSKRVHILNKNNELGKLSIVINEMFDRLEISFKSQTKFISNASHELRTPLAVIKGYADLLDAGAKSDPAIVDHSVAEILKEVNNMENLLKKLLFLARKQNETITSNIQPFDISTLITELMEKQALVDKNHQYITLRNKPSVLNLDKDLSLQVLRELLKNSSKYTDEGGEISIDSYIKKPFHYIDVKDTGKGIPKSHIQHIFERFYIQDESRNRQKNSFGLGLSIVKDIVELHGGEITVNSELNKGTTMTIKIPIS